MDKNKDEIQEHAEFIIKLHKELIEISRNSFDNKDEIETIEKLMKLIKDNFWGRLRIEKSTVDKIVNTESKFNRHMELKKELYERYEKINSRSLLR